MAVDEALEGVRVDTQGRQDLAGIIVCLAHHSEEKVIRPYSVATGPHCLLAGVTDNAVELVRYLDFHIFKAGI